MIYLSVMMTFKFSYIFLFLHALYLLCGQCLGNENINEISITSAEYCHGCTITVEIMGQLASKGIKDMERAKIDPSDTLDVNKLSSGLCSRSEFSSYRGFVHDSCVKLMSDHKYHFLHAFAGQHSTLYSAIRGNMFRAKRAACVNETNACPPQLFSVNAPAQEDRTPCNACYELAKDIEALKFVLRQPSSNTQIIGDICEKLASSHMPYSWIESHCEDIMDEYSDDIVVALVERDRLKLSPFTSPVSKLLCQNMMGCARPPWESANEL
mmetsp:Transcript_7050/g.11806  ORF Transcript_7050/g.11806 Transcript_7050/m.11806 type:complete len:268 (-) Transcript_7050:1993-2796(-)